MRRVAFLTLTIALAASAAGTASQAQQSAQQPPAQTPPRQQRPQAPIDEARARQLYVSKDPNDHSRPDFARDIAQREAAEKRYAEASKGVMSYRRVTVAMRSTM